jgi:hypothetical protein
MNLSPLVGRAGFRCGFNLPPPAFIVTVEHLAPPAVIEDRLFLQ